MLFYTLKKCVGFIKCVFLKQNALKMLFHIHYKYRIFYSVNVPKCLFKYELTENAVPHTLQVQGFSLVCVLVCFLRLRNDEPHASQEKDFFLVCICLQFFQLILPKMQTYTSQKFPECNHMYVFKCGLYENLDTHHKCKCFPCLCLQAQVYI